MAVMAKTSEAASASSAEPTGGRDVRVVLVTVCLGLLLFPFALTLLAVQSRWAPLLRVDNDVRDSLNRYALAHPVFVAAMKAISYSGSVAAWVVVLGLVAAWLLWRRLPVLGLFVVTTALGSSVLNVVVKTAVHRLRPVVNDPVAIAHGLSFPSGHAQAAVGGYTVLMVVLLPALDGAWRKAAIAFAVLMVLAIGFSRIALGVHYVSDVVGGFVLGAAWVVAMMAGFNVMGADRARRGHLTAHRSARYQCLRGNPGG
jgi:membrane-associated phospholipid phosphatase